MYKFKFIETISNKDYILLFSSILIFFCLNIISFHNVLCILFISRFIFHIGTILLSTLPSNCLINQIEL